MNYELKVKIFVLAIFAVFVVVFSVSAQIVPKPDFFLFWSADTYIPNDYPGKSLPVYDSWVTVTAVVSGKNINPDKMVYYWWVNGQFQEEATGLGRKNFRYHIDIVPPGANIAIKASIENENKSIDLEKTIVITTATPEVGLYQYNPAAKRVSAEVGEKYDAKFGEQMSFMAKPFFFSVQKISDLIFRWRPEGGGEIESKDNVFNLKIPVSEDVEEFLSGFDLSVENPFSSVQKEFASVSLNITK
ncbi:MAG: hypothetical protein AAB851_01865 [Patescibacteria group bacterium]